MQSNRKRLMREVVALYKIEISSFCMKQRFKDADYICVAKNTSTHTNFNSIYSCHFSLIFFFINNEQTSIRPMTNCQSSTGLISISINVFTTQAITSTYLHSINNLNIFTGYNKLCLRGRKAPPCTPAKKNVLNGKNDPASSSVIEPIQHETIFS